MSADAPVPRELGLSGRKERRWGLIGGVVGSLAGGGSAFVAVALDGAPLFEGGAHPSTFARPELLALDVYFVVMLLAGAGFAVAGLLSARRSLYPRTDAYGAGLIGLLLSVLAGMILFVRLWAVVAP